MTNSFFVPKQKGGTVYQLALLGGHFLQSQKHVFYMVKNNSSYFHKKA
jgi:hypothetical protein